MSLIVARQADGQITIVSDTKLSLPKALEDAQSYKQDPKDGTIKTIIINDNLCISFAGGYKDAKDALARINKLHTLDDVIPILLDHHNKSKWDTVFIACEGYPQPRIIEINTGEARLTENAWIGDSLGFNAFQSSILSDNKNGSFHIRLSLHAMEKISEPVRLSKMLDAINSVIENPRIYTVGGFCTHVRFEKKFFYSVYLHSYMVSKTYRVRANEIVAIGHANANEGGYTVNFIGSDKEFENVAIHVRQGEIGILYTKDENVFQPTVFKMKEKEFSEFISGLGIKSLGSTPPHL